MVVLRVMKTPVIPVSDFIVFLESIKNQLADRLKEFPSPAELRTKTAEALSARKKDDGALLFSEILCTIKEEAYCEGQVNLLQFFIEDCQNKIKNSQAESTKEIK
jgi:hypothetical protein